MGVNLSELNWIGGRVNREMTSTPADVTDYNFAAKDAGVELPESEYDRGDLLELVRFTADALHDADTIREEATNCSSSCSGHSTPSQTHAAATIPPGSHTGGYPRVAR